MEYKVIIPDTEFILFEFLQNKKKGGAAINIGLRKLTTKFIFPWNLSVLFHSKEVNEESLPKREVLEVLDKYEDYLQKKFNFIPSKPNALFLGKITWNGTIELIWRVHKPKQLNNILEDIISNKEYPVPFDYRIDYDNEWELVKWHLKERRGRR